MFLRAIARPLLATWFIYGGVQSILDPDRRAERSAPLIEPVLEESGLDIDMRTFVQTHGALSVLAGVTLAFSKTPRTSALSLAGLATITAVAGRPFWIEEDAEERSASREAFVKNVSLLGGALIAATAGNRPKKRKKRKR